MPQDSRSNNQFQRARAAAADYSAAAFSCLTAGSESFKFFQKNGAPELNMCYIMFNIVTVPAAHLPLHAFRGLRRHAAGKIPAIPANNKRRR